MFCYNCGKKLEDDMIFCPYCGAKMVGKVKKENKNIWKIAIPSFVMIGIIIAIVIGGYSKKLQNEENETESIVAENDTKSETEPAMIEKKTKEKLETQTTDPELENTTPIKENEINYLTIEDVVMASYVSSQGNISMEIGTYSGDGTIYVNFMDNNSNFLWIGEFSYSTVVGDGGIAIAFNGSKWNEEYSGVLTESILISWPSPVDKDYPTVYYDSDSIGISGAYSYEYSFVGTN